MGMGLSENRAVGYHHFPIFSMTRVFFWSIQALFSQSHMAIGHPDLECEELVAVERGKGMKGHNRYGGFHTWGGPQNGWFMMDITLNIDDLD